MRDIVFDISAIMMMITW